MSSHGELAQTGERSLCMREAPGSIPGFSIITFLEKCISLSVQLRDSIIIMNSTTVVDILGSIVVSIPACHAGDRGSIPRRGGYVFTLCIRMKTDQQFSNRTEITCALLVSHDF